MEISRNIIYEMVPRVFQSPTPLLPQGQGQAAFGSGCFRRTMKLLSNQTPTNQTHHTLTSSFLSSFQTVQPSVSSLGSLRPISTNDYDMPGLQSHPKAFKSDCQQTRTYGKITEISVSFTFLALLMQHR
jgi:hypothetical protein